MLRGNVKFAVAATSVSDLWTWFDPEALKQAKVAEDEIEHLQADIVADRIAEVARRESNAT
eukprot:6984818-Lingulodinium_polyedra.AAC.1